MNAMKKLRQSKGLENDSIFFFKKAFLFEEVTCEQKRQ